MKNGEFVVERIISIYFLAEINEKNAKFTIQQGRNFSSFPLGPIMSFKINFSQEIERQKEKKNFCLPHCGKIRYFVQKFLHF